jgi:hypothetical protein
LNVLTPPEAGSLSFDNANNIITYTPEAGRLEDVTFTYTVTADGRTSEEATVTLSANSLTDGESAHYTFHLLKWTLSRYWRMRYGMAYTGKREVNSHRQKLLVLFLNIDLFPMRVIGRQEFDMLIYPETGILYFAGVKTLNLYALADGSDTVFSPANGWANERETHASSPFVMGDSDWGGGGPRTANPINGFVPDDGTGVEEVNWVLRSAEEFHSPLETGELLPEIQMLWPLASSGKTMVMACWRTVATTVCFFKYALSATMWRPAGGFQNAGQRCIN